MDLEHSQVAVEVQTGAHAAVKKRPVTSPIDQYLKKRAPVKYQPTSDIQKRADLDIMIYLATANLPFSHLKTDAFKRWRLLIKRFCNIVAKHLPREQNSLEVTGSNPTGFWASFSLSISVVNN